MNREEYPKFDWWRATSHPRGARNTYLTIYGKEPGNQQEREWGDRTNLKIYVITTQMQYNKTNPGQLLEQIKGKTKLDNITKRGRRKTRKTTSRNGPTKISDKTR